MNEAFAAQYLAVEPRSRQDECQRWGRSLSGILSQRPARGSCLRCFSNCGVETHDTVWLLHVSGADKASRLFAKVCNVRNESPKTLVYIFIENPKSRAQIESRSRVTAGKSIFTGRLQRRTSDGCRAQFLRISCDRILIPVPVLSLVEP